MPMDEVSIERINRWDDDAVTMLYRQFYQLLVSYAWQLVGDVATAEDVVQDMFLATISRRNQFASIGSLRAYLYNATHNQCLNHLRNDQVKRSNLARIEAEGSEASISAFAEAEGERLNVEAVYQQLFLAIDALPQRQREIFLQLMQGKKNHDIAKALNISINTLKTLKQRGMETLRGKLSPDALTVLLTML